MIGTTLLPQNTPVYRMWGGRGYPQKHYMKEIELNIEAIKREYKRTKRQLELLELLLKNWGLA